MPTITPDGSEDPASSGTAANDQRTNEGTTDATVAAPSKRPCNTCGVHNVHTAKHCKYCGSEFLDAVAVTTEDLPVAPAPSPDGRTSDSSRVVPGPPPAAQASRVSSPGLAERRLERLASTASPIPTRRKTFVVWAFLGTAVVLTFGALVISLNELGAPRTSEKVPKAGIAPRDSVVLVPPPHSSPTPVPPNPDTPADDLLGGSSGAIVQVPTDPRPITSPVKPVQPYKPPLAPARPTHLSPEVAVPTPKPEPAIEPKPVLNDPKITDSDMDRMRRELEQCREKGFLERQICRERIRWKYCSPDKWNRTQECAVQGGQSPNTN